MLYILLYITLTLIHYRYNIMLYRYYTNTLKLYVITAYIAQYKFMNLGPNATIYRLMANALININV